MADSLDVVSEQARRVRVAEAAQHGAIEPVGFAPLGVTVRPLLESHPVGFNWAEIGSAKAQRPHIRHIRRVGGRTVRLVPSARETAVHITTMRPNPQCPGRLMSNSTTPQLVHARSGRVARHA